ncbi:MAG: SGNH/GDSL hydrolase family protein [Vicinamibacterales bacterium]
MPRWVLPGLVIGALGVACTETPTRPTDSPRLSSTRFMAFGDSITAGEVTVPVSRADDDHRVGSMVVVPSASYPAVLADLLRSGYPTQADSIQVVNEGKPAEAAAVAMPRFLAALETHRPEAVLLMEGYNDVCCGGMTVGRNVAAAVGALAAEARRRGARVFVATLAPSKPGFRAGSPEALAGFNEAIPIYVAMGHDVLVDVFWSLQQDIDANIGVDGLHPTEVGYRRIAQAFYVAIRATLEVPR